MPNHFMAVRKDPAEIAKRMAEQRETKAARQKELVFSRQLDIENIDKGLARTADGSRKIDLKIIQHGEWKLRIGLKRETAKKMGMDFHEGDPIPRETTWIDTDVYHAVRLFGHIEEGHEVERKRIFDLLKQVDDFHSRLYTHGDILPEKELNEILGIVQEVIEIVSKKEAGYKILAEWKLETVPNLIIDAIKENHPFKKRNRISNVCSALMAFKERYGSWRVRQTYGIDNHDLLRQNVVRQIRNERMKETLRDLARKLEGLSGIAVGPTLVIDWDIITKLRNEASDNVTVGRGKPDTSLEIIADCGLQIKAEWLKKELREVYRSILRGRREHPIGWRGRARNKLEEFARHLGQRNTFYILAELNETGEPVMISVIRHIEKGNTLLMKGDEEENFGKKKMFFREAGREFRKAGNAIPVQ